MRLRNIGVVLALASLSTCNCADQQGPVLTVQARPTLIDGLGERATITIRAVADIEVPGQGEVTLQASAGELSAQAMQLDLTGTAEATWSCSVALDARCQGTQTITAQWQGLTRTVRVTVQSQVGGGLADAGEPDAGPRCLAVIAPNGPISQCPLEDGGSCLTRPERDGGVTTDCVGAEGSPCLTMDHCVVGLTCTTRPPVINGAIGVCTSWICTTPTGSCGDGGYCIDLVGNPTCTSGTGGSACGDNSHCRAHDAGVCLLIVTAAGSGRRCSYGLPGDPCNQPEDCASVACQTTAYPPSCL